MSTVEDLAGKWEVDSQGDPDTFMAAIGMGWLKRKAIGVALTLGFGRWVVLLFSESTGGVAN